MRYKREIFIVSVALIAFALNAFLMVFLTQSREKPVDNPQAIQPPAPQEPQETKEERPIYVNVDISEKDIENNKYLKLISQKIIDREVVPDAYLVFVKDRGLMENIKEFNDILTYRNPGNAGWSLNNIFALDLPFYGTYEPPPLGWLLAERVDRLSLYKNALHLMYNDPEIAQSLLIGGEVPAQTIGYSSALAEWNEYISTGGNLSGGEDRSSFFALIDKILFKLPVDRDKITEKILNRQVVESDYFSFIEDEKLLESIEKYNELTSKYYFEFMSRAIPCVYAEKNHSWNFTPLPFTYFNQRPQEVEKIAPLIARYSLYRNRAELIYNIPYIYFDTGSGVGQWPRFFASERIPADQLEAYFTLADDIMSALN